MDKTTFSRLLAEAETIGGDYASGYLRGLRRLHHGEGFGTAEEHERMMALDAQGDPSREAIARGYRDGYAGARPNCCREQGCGREPHAKGLCRPHYAQQLRRQAGDVDAPLRPVRQPGEPREMVGVRFAPDVRARLEELAEARGSTTSDLVREAVAAWLEQRPQK